MKNKVNIWDGLNFSEPEKKVKVSLNEPYLSILNEIIEERVGKNSIKVETNKEDTRISLQYKNYGLSTICTENGSFYFEKANAREPIIYRFNNLDMFREYAIQVLENECKPVIIDLFKLNKVTIPEKMEAPKINIDLSKITTEWITETFQEITDDIMNGDYIENVIIEKNFKLPSGATSGKEAYEDGIKITFNVWWKNWSKWQTVKDKYSIKVNNKGNVSVYLPEAIEGGGIENELKEKITEFIKI